MRVEIVLKLTNSFTGKEIEIAPGGTEHNLDVCSLISDNDICKLINLVEEFKVFVGQKFAQVFAKQDGLERLIKIKCESADDKIDDQTSKIFPLNSKEDINQFEENLKNYDYRCEVVAHLKRITGTAQRWKSASYKLSATLFTKSVLTMYSWTGVSRTNIQKDAFNKLPNILDAFYQVIYYADNSFTHVKMEEFFRDCILKHSQSRLNPKKRMLNAKNLKNSGDDRSEDDNSMRDNNPTNDAA